MAIQIRMSVNTPLGRGTVQGGYTIRDGRGEAIATGVLVRLPINDETSKARKQSNCITPRAIHSGLWVFPESELK